MNPYPDHKPILKNSAPMRLLPLVGLMPFTVTVCGSLSAWLDGTHLRELTTPLIAMTAISVFLSLFFGVVAIINTMGEAGQIRKVLNKPLAAWPQYADEGQWAQALANYLEYNKRTTKFNISGTVVLTVAMIAVSVLTLIQGYAVYLLVIWAFAFLIYAFIFAAPVVSRMRSARLVAGLKNGPIPMTVIGQDGIYSPFRGFESLIGLRKMEFVAPGEVSQKKRSTQEEWLMRGLLDPAEEALDGTLAASGWGLVTFTVRKPIGFGSGVRHDLVHIVRVPPDHLQHVQTVLSAVKGKSIFD